MFNEKVRKALARGCNVKECKCKTCGRVLAPMQGKVIAITNSDYIIDCLECYNNHDSKGNKRIDTVSYSKAIKTVNNDGIMFQVSFNLSNKTVASELLDIARLLNKHSYNIVKVNKCSYKVTSPIMPNLNGINKMITSLNVNFKVDMNIKTRIKAIDNVYDINLESICNLGNTISSLKDLRRNILNYM